MLKWLGVLTMVCNVACKVFLPSIIVGGETQPFLASSVKIAALGDSVTQNGYPPYLSTCAGGQTVNYGVGHTSINGALKYTSTPTWTSALGSQANLFLMMFGINDSPSYSWNGVQAFKDAYKAMIAQVRAANPNAEIVLMTPTHAYTTGLPTQNNLINGEISQAVRDIVTELNSGGTIPGTIPGTKPIKLIDMNVLTDNHSNWTTDGIHHNNLGIQEITKIICAQLSALNLSL